LGHRDACTELMEPLGVVTWNLLGRLPRHVGLDRLVAEWDPALLMLQEANGDAIGADERLTRTFPHRFMVREAGYRPGMAILSRHPITKTGSLRDPPRAFDRPRLLWAEILLPAGGTVVAASVHAAAPDSLLVPPYNPIRRNRQLAAIRAFAQALPDGGSHAVIGGDFNTVRYRIEGMIDAAEAGGAGGPTWRGLPVRWMPPLLRLDRLFVGRGFRVTGARVGTAFHGSDHCPVGATLADE
jgi:endonuclease/exonuclease/phosphatase family metal-dependent hydrolase